MTASLRSCKTILSNLASQAVSLRCPTVDEHDSWQIFAREHSPRLHPLQSDVSRVSAITYLWASHHHYVVPVTNDEEIPYIRIVEEPWILHIQARTLRNTSVNYYFKEIRAQHAWVQTLCDVLLGLKKLRHELVALLWLTEDTYEQLNAVFESLQETYELFHPGVLVDSVIDYETCKDTVKLVVGAIKDILLILPTSRDVVTVPPSTFERCDAPSI